MVFLIPTPYFIPPSDQINENELLAICLSELANPPDLNKNPYWESFVGQIFLLYQRYTVGQFVRKSLDKNFPHWKMPKHWDKRTKEIINLEGNLLGQTWKLIRLLPSDQNPRPITLYTIALEKKSFSSTVTLLDLRLRKTFERIKASIAPCNHSAILFAKKMYQLPGDSLIVVINLPVVAMTLGQIT